MPRVIDGSLVFFGIVIWSLFLWPSVRLALEPTRTLLPTASLALPVTPPPATPRPTPSSLSYEALLYRTENHMGEYVKISGEVLQFTQNDDGDQAVIINMTHKGYGWGDPIVVVCIECVLPVEGQRIDIAGIVVGRDSIKDTSGIPLVMPVLFAVH